MGAVDQHEQLLLQLIKPLCEDTSMEGVYMGALLSSARSDIAVSPVSVWQ
jgi:hypothetical protein